MDCCSWQLIDAVVRFDLPNCFEVVIRSPEDRIMQLVMIIMEVGTNAAKLEVSTEVLEVSTIELVQVANTELEAEPDKLEYALEVYSN